MILTDLVGKNVFIRTVTNYYIGLLVQIDEGFIHLSEASWIADTGRFSQALKSGTLNEVEPYPGDCLISGNAVVDICEWTHDLPRTVR